jgi:DNA helicase-2/ATP-dependent DNA helicase PcrA
MEVRDVLSMLRFLCNPRDGISFARVANKPARGLGDAVVGKLEYFAEQKGIDLMDAMDRAVEVRDEDGKPLSDAGLRACQEALRVFGVDVDGKTVADITRDILGRTRYDEWLKERYEERGDYEDRRRNVDELVSSIEQFCWTNRHATLSEYLESISLFTDSNKDKDDDAVRLMSLHASKGLEFDVVYILGAEHGVLPHDKAVVDRGEKGLDEERRLCYVGFTRARKLLRVTWCERRVEIGSASAKARYKKSRPSRFLVEAGLMTPQEYRAFGGPQ